MFRCCFFFFQAEDGIRDLVRSRGLGDVYKRQEAVRYADLLRVAPLDLACLGIGVNGHLAFNEPYHLSLIHI